VVPQVTGRWNGLVGDLMEDRADVAMPLGPSHHRSFFIDFSFQFSQEPYYFFVR
jgi:hypothetical protein